MNIIFISSAWISELFPKCADNTELMKFDSKTNFKKDMISYLESYKDGVALKNWIEIVKQHDMTSAK